MCETFNITFFEAKIKLCISVNLKNVIFVTVI